ncbi:MAG: carboxymuconolactone decarboxylase family protein [Alphaproteobacteria bacterium]|nr:carboxymuconolactone decarboxylase family protein [Alphaproteobacteria bacterium]
MTTDIDPKASESLPSFAGDVAARFPDIWKTYQALGEAAAAAGPLTEREQRLVKIALAIGSGSEGATHSHARRARREGIDAAALQQIPMLAITSLGWSQAMRGLAWIEDVFAASQARRRKDP